ncbi:MAG: UDP-N-acetylmuramoyl-tripeptide--D-alanyl-D-alanine ligase [Deltaproteobacteria bacterium]|nr:UDP-N-acetylmuramoyl-tripeptide--D-alanyl-D-alanine ligase [Deltaproteobacteria bacterium]
MDSLKLEMLLKTFRTEFFGTKNEEFLSVSTDSRQPLTKGLFFALTGERFDGHDFVSQAIDNGHTGIVIRKDMFEKVKERTGRKIQDVTVFCVPDTLKSLGDLASAYLLSKKAKRFAITGSCGKTTTKELLASMLSAGYKVIKTEGNLNNLIGLPLTAFRVESDTDFAVLEMGMNAFGEIKRLTEISLPHIAAITNVRPAHLEGVGSIDGVLKAKWELFENSPEECICVINLDDERIKTASESLKRKKITCSLKENADVMLTADPVLMSEYTDVRLKITGKTVSVRLPLPGLHNVSNLLVASAAAVAAGISIDEITAGAESVIPVKGRMNILRFGSTILVDDSYNANPASVEGALRFLSSLSVSQRIAVLADMLELGLESSELHNQIGALVAKLGNIDALVLFGREISYMKEGAVRAGYPSDRIFMAVSHQDAVSIVKRLIRGNTAVLIKGSHSMHMEKVVEELKAIL